MLMNRKVLIITYYWPPSGGAGVQRWVKFAKYLPENGWEPVILTVDPAYAAYPVTDNSLSSEVSESLTIYKTPARDYFSVYKKDRSKIPSAGFAVNPDNTLKGKLFRFIRGNFFIPDPRRGWNDYAFRKASELIESMDIRHIITTSPPHSTQLIGLRLKKTFPQLRWIADLRDPWTDIYYYKQFYPTLISKSVDSGYERSVLKRSDAIITVGQSLKSLFSSKTDSAAAKTHIITNGYDPDDFQGEAEPPAKLTITYAGTLSDIYPIKGFIEALDIPGKGHKEFILRFVGSVSQSQKELILSKVGPGNVQFIPYCDHSTAVKYMRESSALLLIIPDHESSRTILTGKLFEYIASSRPVICLGPAAGDAALIIQETGAGNTFDYYDTTSIGNFILKIAGGGIKPAQDSKEKYSRKELTKSLALILRSQD